MSSLIVSLFGIILMLTFHPIQCTSSGSIIPNNLVFDEKFVNTTLTIYRTQVIPEQIQNIMNQLRMNCQKAMKKPFEKCLKRFNDDAHKVITGNSNLLKLSSYDPRWPTCCVIFNHHKCIERAIERNSFYTVALCDTTDVSIAESILDQTDHGYNTGGFCPSNSNHIEYRICDGSYGSIFGDNPLTAMVTVMGGITLTASILLAIYVFHRTNEQRKQRRFQLLESEFRFEMSDPVNYNNYQ